MGMKQVLTPRKRPEPLTLEEKFKMWAYICGVFVVFCLMIFAFETLTTPKDREKLRKDPDLVWYMLLM